MWFFTVPQTTLTADQYRNLQKLATLAEAELFNEPYPNLYLFEVTHYQPFVDCLDREGIAYEAYSERPTRAQLLEAMR